MRSTNCISTHCTSSTYTHVSRLKRKTIESQVGALPPSETSSKKVWKQSFGKTRSLYTAEGNLPFHPMLTWSLPTSKRLSQAKLWQRETMSESNQVPHNLHMSQKEISRQSSTHLHPARTIFSWLGEPQLLIGWKRSLSRTQSLT